MKIRFGLRTAMIVFTLACVLIGGTIVWFRMETAEFHRVEQVVQRIEQLDAVVSWQPIKPAWLEAWLSDHGLNVFKRPYCVDCLTKHVDIRDIHQFGNNPNMAKIVGLLPELPTVYVLYAYDIDLKDEQLHTLANDPNLRAIIVDTSTMGPYLEDMMHLNGEIITPSARLEIAQKTADYSTKRIAELQQAVPNLEVVSAH